MMRVRFARWLLVALAALAFQVRAADQEATLIVFAASSLTDVMQELGTGFTSAMSIPVKFSFAASSALAKQIENGARADVFVSADLDWMDYLQERNQIQKSTRKDVVGNRLVLIAPVSSTVKLKIAPHFPLAATLGQGRLATGDPDSVPVGRYAKAALSELGVWNDVADRLVRAENVRAALAFVGRGEAALGIVYETDARADKNVRVVDVFPEKTHPPIRYPIALTTGAKSNAAKFVDYVEGSAGQAAFKKYGFTALK